MAAVIPVQFAAIFNHLRNFHGTKTRWILTPNTWWTLRKLPKLPDDQKTSFLIFNYYHGKIWKCIRTRWVISSRNPKLLYLANQLSSVKYKQYIFKVILKIWNGIYSWKTVLFGWKRLYFNWSIWYFIILNLNYRNKTEQLHYTFFTNLKTCSK